MCIYILFSILFYYSLNPIMCSHGPWARVPIIPPIVKHSTHSSPTSTVPMACNANVPNLGGLADQLPETQATLHRRGHGPVMLQSARRQQDPIIIIEKIEYIPCETIDVRLVSCRPFLSFFFFDG